MKGNETMAMTVKELVKQLLKLPQDSEIRITAMDDYFVCTDFEVHSSVEDGSQEIILPYYFERYMHDTDNDITDITGVYTEENE